MNGKKARAAWRAVARSRVNSRLSRKAAGMARSERESAFDRRMKELRDERAVQLKMAELAYEQVVKDAAKERRLAVSVAEAEYVEARDAAIRELAAEAEEAA